MPGSFPPRPSDETARLEALSRYHLLDTAPEPLFDGLAHLAALICHTPMALVSLIDEQRQWFKAKVGLDISETPRAIAFCAQTIKDQKLFVVDDTLQDERFRNNPLVTGAPGIRFYAGAPLITPDGYAIGTIAVLDREAKEITSEQRKGLVLLAEHIVDHLEANRHAQDTMQALEAVVDACPLAITALDAGGKVVLWNESARTMFGFSEEEALGRLSPIIPDSEQELFHKTTETLRAGNVLRNCETKGQRKDGTLLDVSVSAAPIRDSDGKYIGLMGVLEDISERKRAQTELQQSLSLLRATLEATADGILAVDSRGRIIGFNQRVLEMWRIPREVVESGDTDSVIRMAAEQLRDPEHFLDKIRRYIAGENLQSWDTLHFKDGRLFERFSQVQLVNGQPVGRVFSYRDITKRVELEEQLRQAQKMEAVGQLAGGIAHDFNNLLNVIVGYSALMQSQISPDEPMYKHSEQVMKAADRAAALTRQLLVFSRRQVLELQVLDINSVVTSFAKMLPRVIGEDIELEINPAAALGNVKADPGQIEQVIMNLAVNARDAMPHGGRLIIATDNATLEALYAGAQVVTPGEYVMLSMSDTGTGMTEDVKAHIFEPFFTTKQPGKGTGLGLATVYGIVHQAGGYIEVASEPDKGSTFRVYFPRIRSEVEQPATARRIDASLGGTETILVVEDEASLRELVRQILQSRGYRVMSAREGSEAIRLAKESKDTIDLIITDVIMPGMRGWEVVEHLKEFRPAVKVLYISGYADDELMDRARLLPVASLLQKPFSPDALARKVREVLAGSNESGALKSA